MLLTRVDHEDLKAATTLSNELVEQLRELLRPRLLTRLTDEDRAAALRPPVRAAEAGRTTAEAAKRFPLLMGAAEYDREAVLEDLDNVAVLTGLAESLREIAQWVDDSRLVWTAEGYFQNLTLYNAARKLEKANGSLRVVVEPFEDMFAQRRKPARNGDAGSEDEAVSTGI